MPHDPYYQTVKHKRWRERVLRRAGYACAECRKYGRNETATHAHHIKPRAEHPELALSMDNGVALCTKCHNKLEPRTGAAR